MEARAARRALLATLARRLALPEDRGALVESDHVLDAAICVLAGHDFLAGQVQLPMEEERPRARKEGWIWFRPPAP